jgi:hypothetical protein
MPHIGEAMLPREGPRPALEVVIRELDGVAARTTDEVVMVGVGITTAKDGLAILSSNHVYFVSLCHRLQVSVNRRETHLQTFVAQGVIQLLRAQERVGVLQRVQDGAALTRRSLPFGAHSSVNRLIITPTPKTKAPI